jgi:hypothetical protein
MYRASITSAPEPMESYHTGYKFGGGPRNEAPVAKFRPPSPVPRVFPKLPASQVGTIAGRRSATARRRVAHQAFVPSPLLRVSCLRISGGRARGKRMRIVGSLVSNDARPRSAANCSVPFWRCRFQALPHAPERARLRHFPHRSTDCVTCGLGAEAEDRPTGRPAEFMRSMEAQRANCADLPARQSAPVR